MRSSLVTGFALVSGSYALARPQPSCSKNAVDPTITSGPTVPMELLRRQNADRFMGWIQYEGEWTTRTCDAGGTLYQNPDQWRCCATTVDSCNVPVGCVSGSLIYEFSTGTVSRATYACTEVYTDPGDSSFTLCNTGFLYENSLDSSPRTNLFCGISAVNWSYYRVKPAEAETSSSESSSSSSSLSSPRSTPANPTSSGPTSTSTADPQLGGGEEKEKEESKAWIAGAVVGPIAGLAIIGAALWFFLRRRKNKKTPPAAGAGAPGAPGSVPPSSYPGSPNTGYQQPYYPPMQQQNNSGFVPYGVGVGSDNTAKHQSFYAPAPQSPHSHGSTSPIPPNSPYAAPHQGQPQQWAPVQQPSSPQMLSAEPGAYGQQQQQQQYHQSPPLSPQPQHPHAQPGGHQVYEQRTFSSELDGTPYQNPAQTTPQQPEAR